MKTLFLKFFAISFIVFTFVACIDHESIILEPKSEKNTENFHSNFREAIAPSPTIPQNLACRKCKIYPYNFTVTFNTGTNSPFMNALNDRIACLLYGGNLTTINSGSWRQYATLPIPPNNGNPTYFDNYFSLYYYSQTTVVLNLAQIDLLAQGFIDTIKLRDLYIGPNQKFRCIKINQVEGPCCGTVQVFYDYTYGTI